MKRKCLAHESCPLMRGYNAIGDWWSLLIVTEMVLSGTKRFSDFQQRLGMARNMLADRLKKLSEQNIIERVPAADGSAYHDYVPTQTGTDLYKVIVALRQWGEKHFPVKKGACGAIVDKKKKKKIKTLEVHAADGRVLKAHELEVTTGGT